MTTLSAWQSSLHSFPYAWRDPAQADGMTVAVNFTATGAQLATEPEQALIADFVPPGQAVNRHNLTIDGVDAVMLDNLLGQDV